MSAVVRHAARLRQRQQRVALGEQLGGATIFGAVPSRACTRSSRSRAASTVGDCSAIARWSSIFAQQLSTMSQPASSAAERTFGDRAVERLHVDIVGQEQPVEADAPANDLVDHLGSTAWPDGRHPAPRRQYARSCRMDDPMSARKGSRSTSRSSSLAATRRQFLVRVAGRTAMARHMLEAADDARARHAVEHCARPSAATCSGSLPSARSPITSSVSLRRTSKRWVVIYGDAHFRQFAAHCLGVGARGLDRGSGCDVVEQAKASPAG